MRMTACNPRAGWESQKKKYKPYFPSSVVIGLDLSGNSLREPTTQRFLFVPSYTEHSQGWGYFRVVFAESI